MSDTIAARVLSLHDRRTLADQLISFGIASESREKLLSHWPSLPIHVDNPPRGPAPVLVALASALGATIVEDVDQAKLLFLGTLAQLGDLLAAAPEGQARSVALAMRAAAENYFAPRRVTNIGGKRFAWGTRSYVMGVINVTPDSFSDDGVGDDVDAAVAMAERLAEEGADIVDVGGESTRPRSDRIGADEELRRVLPVVERLARTLPVPVSIDTYKARVAAACLDAGAAMVNDIWGLRADPDMAGLVARRGVPVVVMHNQQGIAYRDLMGDIVAALRESLEIAEGAGIRHANVVVDPGIGFGKSKDQNLEVLRRLDELQVLGRPILLGTSRKSTIGFVLNLPPTERVEGTAATVALGLARGADIVRVHDVRQMVRVCRMCDAVLRRHPTGEDRWAGQTG